MSTEATKPKSPKTSGPAGNFDESGKFVPSSRANYGAAMKELITRHNDLVDASALLWDPEVIKWLLQGDNVTDKPSAIQNAANGIRQLIDQRLEEASTNARQGAQATLDALRTKLAEEHAEALAALRDEHDRQRTAANQEYVNALKDKDAQIAMRDRLDTYVADVHGTVNAFIKLFGASLGVSVGIHPLDTAKIRSNVLRKRFRISSFEFILVTTRPDGAGYLRDTLTVATAEDSDMPLLVPTQLELRTNPLDPGLSDKGRDTLDSVLRKLTHNWFRETAPRLTDEELAQIFRDPQAARRHFDAKQRKRAGGSVTLESLLGLGSGNKHVCGPECQEQLLSAISAIDGEDGGLDILYVGDSPLGVPGDSGLDSFGYVASGLLGSRLFAPRRSGFGSRQNPTTEPQADPYHYDHENKE